MKTGKTVQRILIILFSITLLATIVPKELSIAKAEGTDFAGGSGTEDDPYLIATKEHLDNVRKDLSANYKMIADIIFTEEDFAEGGAFYNNGLGWSPIVAFRGVFDGNNKIIQGLTITVSNSLDKDMSIGLFGEVSNGVVKNINILKMSILVNNNHYSYIGCVVGYAFTSEIKNCSAEGQIVATNELSSCALYAGGIVGESAGSSVSDVISYVCITTEGNDRIGGICGHNSSGTILKAVNHGDLIGTSATGGIVGETSNSNIEQCSNYGDLHCEYPVEPIHGTSSCGGIAAWASNQVNISLCSNYGNVSAYSPENYNGVAAGIVADGNDNCTISKCFNVGDITTQGGVYTNAGGIASTYYFSKICDCFNAGKIVSTASAGGIVSFAQGINTSTCYNAGEIVATCGGGLAGEIVSSEFVNCIYKDDVNNACGASDNIIARKCTATEMQEQLIFVDWDFNDIWEFVDCNEYPFPTLRDIKYFVIDETSVRKADINGDGVINNRDAVRLMQYLAGWDVEYINAALDVNSDGVINNRDAVRLMQYLAGWDVTID